MLSKLHKVHMAKALADFRERTSNMLTQRQALNRIPFDYSFILFNTGFLSPCMKLGRQLVLKIVDELLDV